MSNFTNSAARRALITGLNQTVAEVQLARMDEMDCDLVEVSSHAGARPTHAVWQGQVYSRSGKHPRYKDFYAETGYGSGDGLCGWNCYHSFYPFFEGLSRPSFERDPAARLGKTNDQMYKESQEQRYYERQVREAKRECMTIDAARQAAGNPELKAQLDSDFSAAAVKLKSREAKLDAFCRETGRTKLPERASVHGFGRSESSKAVWANRKAEIGNGEREKSVDRNNPRRANILPPAEYAKRFAGVTGSSLINAHIASKAADMLRHRNGTGFEDMYLFDAKTGKVIASQTHSKTEQKVTYNQEMIRAIKKQGGSNLIALHNHPDSLPPSGSDFESLFVNGYKKGVIACHDGTVYAYQVGKERFSGILYDMTVAKYRKYPYNLSEKQATLKTLEDFSERFGVRWSRHGGELL